MWYHSKPRKRRVHDNRKRKTNYRVKTAIDLQRHTKQPALVRVGVGREGPGARRPEEVVCASCHTEVFWTASEKPP